MKKLATLERLRILRTGQSIPCSKCGGNFKAIGDPKTTAVFRCDKCEIGMVLTVKLVNQPSKKGKNNE